MTNTESSFSSVASLTPGLVLADWAEFGEIGSPAPIGQIDGIAFVWVPFVAGGGRKLPLDAEVRLA